jgi:hypothetical protein
MANVVQKPPALANKGFELAVFNMAGNLHIVEPMQKAHIERWFESFRNHFSQTFSVVIFEDGKEVKRVKGKGKF